MKLLNTFNFILAGSGIEYSAQRVDEEYTVSWVRMDGTADSIGYRVSAVKEYLADGTWTLLEEPKTTPDIAKLSLDLFLILVEKNKVSELRGSELGSLLMLRAMITRLIDDGS